MRQSGTASLMASALMLASLMGLLGSLHLPGANAQFGRGCADLGDALLNDACSGFVSYVKDSNEYYYGRTNAELRTYISKTPAPSAQCCVDASQFVSRGCSCNTVFVQYVAANRGYTAKTLAVVARAVQLSTCSATTSIANPCDSATPASAGSSASAGNNLASAQAAPVRSGLVLVP